MAKAVLGAVKAGSIVVMRVEDRGKHAHGVRQGGDGSGLLDGAPRRHRAMTAMAASLR